MFLATIYHDRADSSIRFVCMDTRDTMRLVECIIISDSIHICSNEVWSTYLLLYGDDDATAAD